VNRLLIRWKGKNGNEQKLYSIVSSTKTRYTRFKTLGFLKIYSDYLADAVGVTSAQVRKDFSLLEYQGTNAAVTRSISYQQAK
jgi:NADH/NAD ratio-sensing transcriptional regulator Rex